MRFRHQTLDPEKGRWHVKSADRPAYITRKFCRFCNGSFMRQLDEQALPLIRPMVLGRATVLSPDQQTTIATWATKTALAALSMEPSRRQAEFGIDRCYRPFHEARLPLPDMRLWLGYRVLDEPVWFTCWSAHLRDPGPNQAQGFGALLALRHLLVLIFASGDAEADVRLHYDAHRALTGVWPVGAAFHWPPPIPVRGDLRHFIDQVSATATWHRAV